MTGVAKRLFEWEVVNNVEGIVEGVNFVVLPTETDGSFCFKLLSNSSELSEKTDGSKIVSNANANVSLVFIRLSDTEGALSNVWVDNGNEGVDASFA